MRMSKVRLAAYYLPKIQTGERLIVGDQRFNWGSTFNVQLEVQDLGTAD